MQNGRRTQLKQKGFNAQEVEIILHAQEVKPIEYLKSIKSQKGGFVSSNETWVIKELVEQSSLSTSVINILINYVLIGKNAPVLEKSLALKVANDWAQNNVESPEDALQKVKQLYAESKSARQSRQKSGSSRSGNQKYIRKETLPDWATEENTGEEIDAQKQEEFRRRLEKIRNRSKGGDN
nr:DnaD domain protein [Marinilactibacillus kalidii]